MEGVTFRCQLPTPEPDGWTDLTCTHAGCRSQSFTGTPLPDALLVVGSEHPKRHAWCSKRGSTEEPMIRGGMEGTVKPVPGTGRGQIHEQSVHRLFRSGSEPPACRITALLLLDHAPRCSPSPASRLGNPGRARSEPKCTPGCCWHGQGLSDAAPAQLPVTGNL